MYNEESNWFEFPKNNNLLIKDKLYLVYSELYGIELRFYIENEWKKINIKAFCHIPPLELYNQKVNILFWHKYPDEKPPKTDSYICYCKYLTDWITDVCEYDEIGLNGNHWYSPFDDCYFNENEIIAWTLFPTYKE